MSCFFKKMGWQSISHGKMNLNIQGRRGFLWLWSLALVVTPKYSPFRHGALGWLTNLSPMAPGDYLMLLSPLHPVKPQTPNPNLCPQGTSASGTSASSCNGSKNTSGIVSLQRDELPFITTVCWFLFYFFHFCQLTSLDSRPDPYLLSCIEKSHSHKSCWISFFPPGTTVAIPPRWRCSGWAAAAWQYQPCSPWRTAWLPSGGHTS